MSAKAGESGKTRRRFGVIISRLPDTPKPRFGGRTVYIARCNVKRHRVRASQRKHGKRTIHNCVAVIGPRRAFEVATYLCCLVGLAAQAPPPLERVSRFALGADGPELQRPARSGAFFDVVGRRAALFGYENRDA